jgi:membrane protease YdiL (CAAX protease family)
MGTVALRIFIYSILPLLIAVVHLSLDKSSQSRERKLEIFLLYLFGVGVAGSGIGGFFGHYFISDSVAESIGWPTGNPFQLEVGFANLAVGILGIVAMGRRDGFREATVIAVTVFGVGPPSSMPEISSRPAIWPQAIPFRTSATFSNRHC